MTTTQIFSVISDQCQSVILTADFFLTACQKLLTSMATVTLGGSKISDWKKGTV